jgi:hypothetical protein
MKSTRIERTDVLSIKPKGRWCGHLKFEIGWAEPISLLTATLCRMVSDFAMFL